MRLDAFMPTSTACLTMFRQVPLPPFGEECLIMSIPKDRVIEARESVQMRPAEFSRRIGVSKSALSQIEDGTTKSLALKTALNIQALTGYRAEWLQDGTLPKKGKAAFSPQGDYLGVRRGTIKLSAGVSGFAVEYENHDAPPIFFRREWFTTNSYIPEKLIALRVQGHSMEPGLFDGDTVVVNTGDATPSDGDVFAINYEGELVIKRLKRDAGEWWITSDNADRRRYPDKRCTADVFIIGRIVYKGSERI